MDQSQNRKIISEVNQTKPIFSYYNLLNDSIGNQICLTAQKMNIQYYKMFMNVGKFEGKQVQIGKQEESSKIFIQRVSPYLEALRAKTRSKITCEAKDHALLVFVEYSQLLQKSKQLYQQYVILKKRRADQLILISNSEQEALSLYQELLVARNTKVETWFNHERNAGFRQRTRAEAEKFISQLQWLKEKFQAMQDKFESLNPFLFVEKIRKENEELRLRVKDPKRISKTQFLEKQMETIKQQFEADIAQARSIKEEAEKETKKTLLLLKKRQEEVDAINPDQCQLAEAKLISSSINTIIASLTALTNTKNLAYSEYENLHKHYYERILKAFETQLETYQQQQPSFSRQNVPRLYSSKSSTL